MMVWMKGGYASGGFCCDECGRAGEGFRWWCNACYAAHPQPGTGYDYDVCGTCRPAPPSAAAPAAKDWIQVSDGRWLSTVDLIELLSAKMEESTGEIREHAMEQERARVRLERQRKKDRQQAAEKRTRELLERERRRCRAALHAELKLLLQQKVNVTPVPCLATTFRGSNYLISYNECGVPRKGQGQWAAPLEAVRGSLSREFFNTQMLDVAVREAVVERGESELVVAGVVCAKLWTGGRACRLVQNVIMRDRPEELDQLMPFIRCFNEYLYRGEAPTKQLTVCRTSRLTHDQGQTIRAGTYRIGMFVATMLTSHPDAPIQVLGDFQTVELGRAPYIPMGVHDPQRMQTSAVDQSRLNISAGARSHHRPVHGRGCRAQGNGIQRSRAHATNDVNICSCVERFMRSAGGRGNDPCVMGARGYRIKNNQPNFMTKPKPQTTCSLPARTHRSLTVSDAGRQQPERETQLNDF